MKKKIVWLVVSCLMVAALVLASCGPAEEEEVLPPEEEEEVVEEEVVEEEVVEEEVVEEEVAGKEMVEDSLGRLVEKPRYGGVFNFVYASGPSTFDVSIGSPSTFMQLTHEALMRGDWTKGPSGTNEASWRYTTLPAPSVYVGGLAESIEVPDPNTIIYHMRKGVYFQDKPPVNGREVDANDVVFTFEYIWGNPRASVNYGYAWEDNLESVTASDKWTVVVKVLPGKMVNMYQITSGYNFIVPHEIVDKYGDMEDWRNSVGTGPFILTDYVPDSSLTLVRNPNYWRQHPLYPEDTMPYLDGVKYLIIPDLSTRMAALRTAKADQLSSVGWEDAESLMKTSPELEYVRYASGSGPGLWMRVDKPELPFYDKRVRHALQMAIDNQEIADTYYGGNAELLSFPTPPIPEFMDFYVPLEELPESSRQLFEYHPDKAKQLLAEAGYPDGFKTEVMAVSTQVDWLSMVKAYWAKIGVDLKIEVKENAVKSIVGYMKKHKEMFAAGTGGTFIWTFVTIGCCPSTFTNYSMVDDPLINETWSRTNDALFDWPERTRLYKEFTPHVIDLSLVIQLPQPYVYAFWQPWVKSYQGEYDVGFSNYGDFPMYIWLDQDLKEEMTGRR